MATRDIRRRLPAALATLAALAPLFLILAPSDAAAAAADAPVAVEVGVVLASNDGKGVDPALANISDKLRKMFPYTSYKMLDRLEKTLAYGETGEFALPGQRVMRVTPSAGGGNKVRLGVQVMEGSRNLLTTTLGLSRGGMVLLAGPSYQNGVLILILSAN